MIKACIGCGLEKEYSLEFFHPDKTVKSGLRSRCRNCINQRLRQHRKAVPPQKQTPEQLARRRELYSLRPSTEVFYVGRKQNLQARYGISVEQYDELFAQQKGLCAICGRTDPSGRLLAVDHCHTSGVVRKLLCGKCNRGIGMFDDDPHLLRRAAEYLEDHHVLD